MRTGSFFSSESRSPVMMADQVKKLLCSGEILAHKIIYRDIASAEGSLTALGEIQNTGQEWMCSTAPTGKEGLVFIKLDSIFKEKIEEDKEEKDYQLPQHDVAVIFRGTNSPHSLLRDFETATGAGSESFLRYSQNILAQIKEKINAGEEVCRISFFGHSLGGADAQNAMAYFIILMAQEPELAASIKGIRLFAYNSAGMPAVLAKNAYDSLQILKEKNKDLKVECFWKHSHGDMVQQEGDTSLFAAAPPELCAIHMIKVMDDMLPVEAHTNFLANAKKIEYYNNQDDSATLYRELTTKSTDIAIFQSFVVSTTAMLCSMNKLSDEEITELPLLAMLPFPEPILPSPDDWKSVHAALSVLTDMALLPPLKSLPESEVALRDICLNFLMDLTADVANRRAFQDDRDAYKVIAVMHLSNEIRKNTHTPLHAIIDRWMSSVTPMLLIQNPNIDLVADEDLLLSQLKSVSQKSLSIETKKSKDNDSDNDVWISYMNH